MNRGFYKNGAFGNNANAQQPAAPVQPQVQPAPEVQQAPAPEVQPAEVPPVKVAAPSAPIVQEPKKEEPAPVEEKHENIPFADPADEADDEDDDDAILEEFSKEWSRDVSDGNTSATNWENFGINVPLSLSLIHI